MAFYEDKRDKTAFRLLQRRGASMTVRNENGIIDDETGMVEYGVDDDHSTVGVFKNIDEKLWKHETVTSESREVVVSAKPFAEETPEFVPAIGHVLVFGTREFKILGVLPISPAGITIVYRLLVAT